MHVTPDELRLIARLVLEVCGVVLDDGKAYLVESRLSPVAESRGCQSFTDLHQLARSGRDRALTGEIVDAITTQETLFFRDTSPFEALQHKVIPELIDSKASTAWPKRLRFWSAACSTGQEPYSIAMVLSELIPNVHSWDIQILATDISDAAIAQASRGSYQDHEIKRGMPPALLQKYFRQSDKRWVVRDELRALVKFRRLNLLEPFTTIGNFDVIMCRNVAIYFGRPVRDDLHRRLTAQLNPDGYYFVGSSESLTDLGPAFIPQRHCRSTFYRPRLATPALTPA